MRRRVEARATHLPQKSRSRGLPPSLSRFPELCGLDRGPQLNDKTPKRGKKECKLWREREGKKSDILGGPAEGGSEGGRSRIRARHIDLKRYWPEAGTTLQESPNKNLP